MNSGIDFCEAEVSLVEKMAIDSNGSWTIDYKPESPRLYKNYEENPMYNY